MMYAGRCLLCSVENEFLSGRQSQYIILILKRWRTVDAMVLVGGNDKPSRTGGRTDFAIILVGGALRCEE